MVDGYETFTADGTISLFFNPRQDTGIMKVMVADSSVMGMYDITG